MHIIVSTLKSECFELDVEDGATVLDVKERLHELLALKLDLQRLLLGRRNLEDHVVLKECGIHEGTRLMLLVMSTTEHQVAEETALIIDCGSCNSRVGFSGDDQPHAVFPTVVGRPRHPSIMVGMCQKDTYVGEEAQQKRGILIIRYPVEHGIITNWDLMEKIWHHSFYNELRQAPEEHPVLVTEAPLNPKANREKLCQVMFETFSVSSLHVASQPVLALQYESDSSTTGLVLEMGDRVTRLVPIYEGCVIAHGVTSLDIGGADLSQHLCKLMVERGYSFSTAAEQRIVNDIKEKLCHVAMDFNAALDSASEEQSYTLPDGQNITLCNELFRCPEVLFQPCQLGCDSPGIVDLAFKAIGLCDEAMRPRLSRNIVLSGGTSLLPGMEARIEQDMQARSDGRVNIVAPPHRQHASFIGASILASRKAFQESWMTSSDYDEHGPDLVNSWPEAPPGRPYQD